MKVSCIAACLLALTITAHAQGPLPFTRTVLSAAHEKSTELHWTMSTAPAAAISSSPKSKGKAFLLSLLVPGLGERYAARPQRGRTFLTSEALLWLGYAGLLTFEDWRKDDYRNLAAAHAGVDVKDKSDSYFVDVGNYDTMDEYNAAKLRQRNLPAYYSDDGYNWSWDSRPNRKKFEDLRQSAERASNRAMFVVGAIVANHLISAIDAVWSVHSYNKHQRSGVGFEFNLGCTPSQITVMVSASR
jgi:hypothetical protein